VVFLGVMASLLMGLGGCVVEQRGYYRYEHGDRIDGHGHRDVDWCRHHREDEHCR
jgi:hypothetical protein